MHRDDVFKIFPETLVIGNGITATIAAVPGQIGAVLKYGGGGTLFLVGTTLVLNNIGYGSTFASNKMYPLGVNEVFNMDLSGDLVLFADGTTTTAHLARAISAGV